MPTAKTLTATASYVAVQEKPSPIVTEIKDDELYNVLFGYGRVAPTAVSYLDEYTVKGGVITNVPGSIAKHWRSGTRPSGGKPQGRVHVYVLPQDATEEDFMQAAGVSTEDLRKLAAMTGPTDIQRIMAELGPDKARVLRDALNQHFGGR